MRVTITGATGTIGRALVGELVQRGDEVTALSRNPAEAGLDVETLGWPDPKGERPPAEAFRGRDAVVHLLGETLAQRWSDDAKREIRDSRVLATRNLVAALATLPDEERPRTLVSQSAVGWYGPRGSERIDEDQPGGDDFLAGVVRDWEAEARKAPGMRVVLTRTGVVLASRGGALAKMLPFFKLGIGGPVAGGKQYVPWVHLDDVVGAVVFLLGTAVRGPRQRHRPRAGHEQGAVEDARARAAPTSLRARARARREGALRRDGHDRDHRPAGRAGTADGAGLRVPAARARGQRSGARPRTASRRERRAARRAARRPSCRRCRTTPCSFQRESGLAGQISQMTTPMTDSSRPNARPELLAVALPGGQIRGRRSPPPATGR